MKFTFDWEDVVRGKIEIDAKNGLEAESIFNQMSIVKINTNNAKQRSRSVKHTVHTLELILIGNYSLREINF